MKTIVVIKPARGVPRRQLAHCYKPIGRQSPEVASITGEDDRVVGLVNGLAYGAVTRHASTDAKSLTADLQTGRVPLRHVVISIDDTADPAMRADAFKALPRLCSEFVDRFAPGSQYVGIVHQDRKHPHCHILIANDVDGLAINWNRDDLKEMQSMSWVSQATTNEFSIEPGRHRGLSRRDGTGMPYPLALGLDALKIAANISQTIEHYDTSPDIFTSRTAKGPKVRIHSDTGRIISHRTIRNLAALAYPSASPSTGIQPDGAGQRAKRAYRQLPRRRIPSPPTPDR
jgi:hypothetical protein